MTVVLGGRSEPVIHFNVKQQNYCFASSSVKKSQIGLIFCVGLVHCDVHGQVWVPFGYSPHVDWSRHGAIAQLPFLALLNQILTPQNENGYR